MARFIKTVLKADTYHSPEGPVVVTPERIRRWVKTHAAMREAGLNTPVCWGHHLSEVPKYPEEQRFDATQLLGARYNAGYFPELRAANNDTELQAVIDVPGAESDAKGNLIAWEKIDGRELKCAISEVSAAVKDRLTDGRGRVWGDHIAHIAIVPYPVVGGQDGFQALSLKQENTVFLSLGSGGWRTMALPNDKDDDGFEDDDVEVEGGGGEVDAGADAGGEVGAEEAAPDLGASEGDVMDAEAGGGANVNQIVDDLATVCNVHLPGATNESDLLQHLQIILSHMKSAMGGKEEQFDGSNNSPVVAEQSPAMMSLLSLNREDGTPVLTPEQKRAAELLMSEAKRLRDRDTQFLNLEQDRYRRRLGKKFERAEKVLTSSVGPAKAKEIITAIGVQPTIVCLSLIRGSEPTEPKLFTPGQVLDLLMQASKTQTADLTRTLSTATEVANPLRESRDAAPDSAASDAESTRLAEQMTKRKFQTNGHHNGSGNPHATKSRKRRRSE